MSQVPSELVSHSKKVCSLYKRALRMLTAYYTARHHFRYEATLMRHRFDLNRDIRDVRFAKQLLLEGEEELFENTHYAERKFPESPGGVAYERFHIPPDFVMDFWHPMEKSRYPKYFKLREQLKEEYIELYKKWYPESVKESIKEEKETTKSS
ncbi:unnamed protein product [Xylocopa violacea]|uniref:NADH dehydrogenase [ubiquinone] 1 beta subcomplex subunit 9 n=1 Tax=Xylocopa violacea TaxID=135666 RepID=A0ABP1PDB9_XYLVO